MKAHLVLFLIILSFCIHALGNEYAIPIIEGILEDRSSDLFLKARNTVSPVLSIWMEMETATFFWGIRVGSVLQKRWDSKSAQVDNRYDESV
jgi:hypothetical protein